MEGETVPKVRATSEAAVSSEKEKPNLVLRTIEADAIDIKLGSKYRKEVRKEGTVKVKEDERVAIHLQEKLPPRAVIRLPIKENQTRYFEKAEPKPEYEGVYPNSEWVVPVPVTEDGFERLSEKRPTFTLDTLPLHDSTRKALGLKAPEVEETIPGKIKEELTDQLRSMEGMTPNVKGPLKEPAQGKTQEIDTQNDQTQESSKSKSGNKIDPERLKKSIENWESKERSSKRFELLLRARKLHKQENTKEVKAEIKKVINELKRLEREERGGKIDDVYKVPEEAKNYVPPSQVPRDVRAHAGTLGNQEAKPAKPKEKSFIDRIFGR
jgi:hypothetical protein